MRARVRRKRVVYRANHDLAAALELYSAPLDASRPAVKLNSPLTSSGRVERFRISPDGSWVAYVADQDVNDRFELYLAPADGSLGPRRISIPPTVVSTFDFDPSSRRLVYLGRPHSTVDYALYSAPVNGLGDTLRLNGSAEHVREFHLSADGLQVAFRSLENLFQAPLGGGRDPLQLTHGAFGSISEFWFDPRGRRLFYRGSQEIEEAFELFTVDTAGAAAPVRLSGPLALGGVVLDVVDFQIGAGGEQAVFTLQETEGGYGYLEGFSSVPTDGSQPPTPLWPQSLPDSAPLPYFQRIGLAPGDSRAVFQAGIHDETEYFDLVSVSLDTTAAVKLNDALAESVGNFRFSPDGDEVFYAESRGLFRVPTDRSSAPLQLVDNSDGHVVDLQLVADGSRVVYRTATPSVVYELYSARTDGSAAPVKLNPTFGARGVVQDFRIDSAGARVVFVAAVDSGFVFELYSAPIDGSAAAVKLNLPLVPGGDVHPGALEFALSADGSRVVYRADQEIDETDEQPWRFRISPDGRRVLYIADQEQDEVFELYASPLGRPLKHSTR